MRPCPAQRRCLRRGPVPALSQSASSAGKLVTLYCTALHCAALCCTALCCTVLHCTVLHCTVLHCAALHYTVPYYSYQPGTSPLKSSLSPFDSSRTLVLFDFESPRNALAIPHQIILPQVGHTQLLDDRQDSPAAAVCAANAAVRDDDVRSLVQDVIVRWVTFLKEGASRGGGWLTTSDLEEFVEEMSRAHPQLHVKYRIW